MTPKEKAKELIKKMLIEYDMPYLLAIECALIAVDEILKSGCTLPSENAYYGDNEEASKYWQEVKNEIEAL